MVLKGHRLEENQGFGQERREGDRAVIRSVERGTGLQERREGDRDVIRSVERGTGM